MVQSNNITLIQIFLEEKTDLEERIYRVTIKSIQASTCYGQKQNKNLTWFGLRRAARWSPLLRVTGGAVVFNHSLVTGGRSTYKGRSIDLYNIHIPQNSGTYFF